ncbi:MAG TPA: hypothetical protein VFU29_17520 [Chitinophagaceae bacterium]|nr:hypothetical protein [Chitinophagaceae bacterium]
MGNRPVYLLVIALAQSNQHADHTENKIDRRENVRDRREDVIDSKDKRGLRDGREDVRDSNEEVRYRRETKEIVMEIVWIADANPYLLYK